MRIRSSSLSLVIDSVPVREACSGHGASIVDMPEWLSNIDILLQTVIDKLAIDRGLTVTIYSRVGAISTPAAGVGNVNTKSASFPIV